MIHVAKQNLGEDTNLQAVDAMQWVWESRARLAMVVTTFTYCRMRSIHLLPYICSSMFGGDKIKRSSIVVTMHWGLAKGAAHPRFILLLLVPSHISTKAPQLLFQLTHSDLCPPPSSAHHCQPAYRTRFDPLRHMHCQRVQHTTPHNSTPCYIFTTAILHFDKQQSRNTVLAFR